VGITCGPDTELSTQIAGYKLLRKYKNENKIKINIVFQQFEARLLIPSYNKIGNMYS